MVSVLFSFFSFSLVYRYFLFNFFMSMKIFYFSHFVFVTFFAVVVDYIYYMSFCASEWWNTTNILYVIFIFILNFDEMICIRYLYRLEEFDVLPFWNRLWVLVWKSWCIGECDSFILHSEKNYKIYLWLNFYKNKLNWRTQMKAFSTYNDMIIDLVCKNCRIISYQFYQIWTKIYKVNFKLKA